MSVFLEKISKNICRVVINRPEKRNALNLSMIKDLRSRLEEYEENPELHVAILAGSGGNFCAGYDLNEIVDIQTARPKVEQIERLLWPLESRLSKHKITIAAIEGHAAGFGYELALKCDYRVADKAARMGFMNRRFGMPIMNGGTVALPKLVGLSRAMDLIGTGKAQLAHESLQYGLLVHVADIGCAQGKCLNLARCLAKFPQKPLLLDLCSAHSSELDRDIELMRKERERSLEYLRQCEPMDTAVAFLRGKLCRHGNFDLGNTMETIIQVTL